MFSDCRRKRVSTPGVCVFWLTVNIYVSLGSIMKVRSWALGVHGLSLLFTTWAYVWFLIYAANENAPLFRTLHAAERNYADGTSTHVPRSYFTLDWIMHPAVSSDAVETVNVLSGGRCE